MKKCPKCKSKMKLIKGKYPWIEYYWVCVNCDYSSLLEEKETPSFRGFGNNFKAF